MRPVMVFVCALFASQAIAQGADMTTDQANCILEYIHAAETSQGADDVMMACVTYRTHNPELFSCIVRQQVKVHSDKAANAVREACLALNK